MVTCISNGQRLEQKQRKKFDNRPEKAAGNIPVPPVFNTSQGPEWAGSAEPNRELERETWASTKSRPGCGG